MPGVYCDRGGWLGKSEIHWTGCPELAVWGQDSFFFRETSVLLLTPFNGLSQARSDHQGASPLKWYRTYLELLVMTYCTKGWGWKDGHAQRG